MGKTGNLCEVGGEIKFEWKVKDFSRLSDKTNSRYESPKFYFCGTSWEIWIYPNGQTENSSDGSVSLYIARTSTGFPVTVDYTLSLKTVDGKTDSIKSYTNTFDTKNSGFGISKFISRSALMERKSQLIPSDTLTVICTLKNSESSDVTGSLFCRLQEISDNFKEVYSEAKKIDFLLKVGEKSIGAHRLVLETRSPVFAAMLSHDTKENQTGEVSIPDIDESTLEAVLLHMYTGDIDKLTTQNALSLYAAADKYDIKDVKEICSAFIKRNLSVEWVCDIIKFAEIHGENELSLRAKEYFKENAGEILETDEWKAFSKENHDIGVELLSTVVKTLLKK